MHGAQGNAITDGSHLGAAKSGRWLQKGQRVSFDPSRIGIANSPSQGTITRLLRANPEMWELVVESGCGYGILVSLSPNALSPVASDSGATSDTCRDATPVAVSYRVGDRVAIRMPLTAEPDPEAYRLLGSATVLDAVPVAAQGPAGQVSHLRIKKDDGALDSEFASLSWLAPLNTHQCQGCLKANTCRTCGGTGRRKHDGEIYGRGRGLCSSCGLKVRGAATEHCIDAGSRVRAQNAIGVPVSHRSIETAWQ